MSPSADCPLPVTAHRAHCVRVGRREFRQRKLENLMYEYPILVANNSLLLQKLGERILQCLRWDSPGAYTEKLFQEND